MTAAFGSSSSTTYASRSALTITAPSGISDGDVLLALILITGNGTTVTPPAGWTQVGSTATASDGSFFVNSSIWKKIASGESGDYTWTPSATVTTQGLMLRYSGVDGDVNDFSSNMIGAGFGTQDRDATGITTTVDGCMLVYAGFDWGDYTADLTPPTGFTERVEVNPLIYAADSLQATAGATGTVTMICNSSVIDPRGAWLLALEPSAGTANGVGSAAGSTTAAAAGGALKSAAGTASGVGSAAATARPRTAAAGAAIGSSSATAVGAKRAAAAGSAAGSAAVSGIGFMSGLVAAAGHAAGVATVHGSYALQSVPERTLTVLGEQRALSAIAENRTLQVTG